MEERKEKKKMQGNEVVEIDLMDLLCVLCGKWKKILAAGMLCAVLGGIFGFVQYVRNPEVPAEEVQTKVKKEDVALSEEQLAAAIASIDRQYEALGSMQEKQQEYLDNSLLMQIDAEKVYYGVKRYLVKMKAEEEGSDGSRLFSIQTILEAYQTYLTGDRVYQAVADSIGADAGLAHISEVITVENSQTGDSAVNLDMGMGSGSAGGSAPGILTVTVKAKDEEQLKKMWDAIDGAVGEVQKELTWKDMEYTVELLAESCYTGFDLGLAQAKLDIQNRIADEENKKVEIAGKRKNYVNQLAALGVSVSKEQAPGEEITGKTVSPVNRKWLLAGFGAGIFLALCYLSVAYVMDGRLHTDSVLKSMTGTLVYRLADGEKGKRGLEGLVKNVRDRDIHKYTVEELAGQMAGILKARGGGKGSSYAVTGSLAGSERTAFYEALSAKAEGYGINIFNLENPAYHCEDAEKAALADGVILVEKLGASRVQEVRDEINCLKEYGILVVGCVV